MSKIYAGARGPAGALVYVDGKPLRPRWDLRNHSPDGFEWGYQGSGPAQLALAICCDHLNDDQRALRVYQDVKWELIANLAGNDWRISSDTIQAAIDLVEKLAATDRPYP